MSVYSIKDLEHLSGIKAHTIRIWEQRYDIFSPQRTSTNIRFYNEDDLKLILNISALRNRGYRISKIVEMSDKDIFAEVEKATAKAKSFNDQIHSLTIAMVDMNELLFVETLDQNTSKYGFEKTMMDIVYPFMGKIGILWLTNSINPAQEHFISHLVRQKLISATDQLDYSDNAPLFLLFLPEGELHELGILLANYMLRVRGMKTIFFGQAVPVNALEEVYHKLEPDFILTSLTTSPDPSAVQQYLNSLSNKFKETRILITGARVVGQDLYIHDNITILSKFEDLEEVVVEVSSNPFAYK
ncbi:MAG: MerR family transcriptional regulator [Bacteroidota bacterium]